MQPSGVTEGTNTLLLFFILLTLSIEFCLTHLSTFFLHFPTICFCLLHYLSTTHHYHLFTFLNSVWVLCVSVWVCQGCGAVGSIWCGGVASYCCGLLVQHGGLLLLPVTQVNTHLRAHTHTRTHTHQPNQTKPKERRDIICGVLRSVSHPCLTQFQLIDRLRASLLPCRQTCYWISDPWVVC